MSEAILLQPVNKPGTSSPEVGVKKKRGPYKKDKPARQRHLEDLVKYLEPKNSSPDSNGQTTEAGSSAAAGSPGHAFGSATSSNLPFAGQGPNANSEDLVKDALIALTKSSVSEQESRLDNGAFLAQNQSHGMQPASGSHHPSVRRIFEYWHIYITRVDPLLKIFHCPTIGKTLFTVIDDLGKIPQSFEALLFSMYYAAVSSCTAREVRQRFGERQDVLMKRYGRCIEAALGDNYDVPALETLQALVLYIICIRRADDGTNLRALFSLAVRSAQIMGVHEDIEGRHSPFETEYRRRLWFHICGLENRTAEEGESRVTSIMQNQSVRLPSNLDDCDLYPRMLEAPRPRQGVTEMTFALARFEIHRLMFGIWSIRRQRAGSWSHAPPSGLTGVREDQIAFLEQATERLQMDYRQYMDPSRPYDWLCLNLIDGMLIKAQLQIDFPFGTIPTKAMPADERSTLLKASVDIIQFTHLLAIDDRVSDWQWYFRGYVQWHSIAIVVAELGWNTNAQFVDTAWQVLDPVLADWDAIYKAKRDEPAWDHVNALIERARLLRRQKKTQKDKSKPIQNLSPAEFRNQACGTPINAQAIMPMQGNGNGYSAYYNDTSSASASQTSSLPPPGSHPCAGPSALMNFDSNFDPSFAGLDNIDFNAFDEVFGSGTWDFMEQLDDVNMHLETMDRCNQVLDMRQ
ncbi:hypothetical protein PRZ48_006791 [Zasmidium cellare]|uniref:Xylanolytic transcriptional activator regulatory domain-containing protein n=1 Tax=Zasmidium cellare TaxID=395010 RepID=A0ABR0EIJ7_ZASCE|nr:hypothetical protein PRZ48_006791 [Zasmidium cellare]